MTRPFDLDTTFEDLQRLKRESVRALDPNLDYRETSLLFNGTVVNSIEMVQMLSTIKYGIDLTFADTAPREYLIRRAQERGLTATPATKARRRGVFNIDVPIGSRYSLGELNYVVLERTSFGEFVLESETPGIAGNLESGNLVPVEFINGLQSAVLTAVLIPGEDEESTESLRKRYFDSYQSVAFGGNRADYKQKTDALPGVGGVRVFRAWNGGGTVKLLIIDSAYGAPTSELITAVQQAVDPLDMQGEGVGFAPIDHIVTVFGVAVQLINLTLPITYQSGYDFADVEPEVNRVVDEYFMELAVSWAASEDDDAGLVVRVSQIESRLLNVNGILDISNVLINSQPSNLQIASDRLPKRGVISD